MKIAHPADGGRATASAPGPPSIRERLEGLDWKGIEAALGEWGYARTEAVLTPAECAELIALYPDASRFRSRVDTWPASGSG